MKKARCPNCRSTSFYIPCTVSGRIKFNGNRNKVYKLDMSNIDCYFYNGITCEKCGWFGNENELKK